jgi:LysM repeat protein
MKWKDTGDAEHSENEAEEEYFEEAYSPLKSRKFASGFNWPALLGKPLFWCACGAIILVILLLIVFSGGDGDVLQRDAFDKRLALLENRLELLDQLDDRLEILEKDGSSTKPLMKRLERLETEIAKKLTDMSNRIDKMQKQLVAAPVKKESKTGGTGVTTGKYHVVQKGETLYSISKKHGLTVEALKQLNKLDKNFLIQPGQRLLLK